MSKRAAGDRTRIAKAERQGVQKISPAAHQDRDQQGERHEQGSHRGHPEPRYKCVEDDGCKGKESRQLLDIIPQQQVLRSFQECPDEEECDQGNDSHVEARNGDDVRGARTVEPVLDVPGNLALLPEGHGLDEGSLGEGGLGADAVADPGPELLHGLHCGIALSLADQDDLPGVVHETPHPYALKPEVALVVERAGVRGAARMLQTHLRPDEIPVFELTCVLPDRQEKFPAHALRKSFA
jgi:hypothetical protein